MRPMNPSWAILIVAAASLAGCAHGPRRAGFVFVDPTDGPKELYLCPAEHLEAPEAVKRARCSLVDQATGPEATGGLEKAVIGDRVRRRKSEVKACYETVLTSSPKLEGLISISFAIAPDGSVYDAVIESAEFHSPELERCLLGIFRELRFPPTIGGGPVTVKYPFSFRRAGGFHLCTDRDTSDDCKLLHRALEGTTDVWSSSCLSRSELEAGLAVYEDRIGACYREALAGESGPAGRAQTRFIIGQPGIVRALRILEAPPHEAFGRCIEQAAASLRFPAFGCKKLIRVTHTATFGSGPTSDSGD